MIRLHINKLLPSIEERYLIIFFDKSKDLEARLC